MRKGFPRANHSSRKWRTVPCVIVAVVLTYGLYTTFVRDPQQAKAAELAHQKHVMAMAAPPAPAPVQRPQSIAPPPVSLLAMQKPQSATTTKPADALAVRAKARFMAMLQEESQKQAKIMQRLDDTHYSDPAKLTTPDEVLAALEAVKDYERVCRRLESIVRDAPETMRIYLAEEGADKDTIDSVLSGMSADLHSGIAFQEAQTALALGVQNKMQLLRDEWGGWSVSSGQVVFKRQSMFERFSALCDQVDAAQQEQDRLAQQFLTAQR
jgi:hypothetical protein